jgi:hypothetical protein
MDNKANHPLRRGCWTCKVTPTGEVTVTPHKYPSTFLLTLPEKKSDAGCKLRDTGRGGARGRRGAIRAQHIMYGAPQPLIRGRLVSAAETALARKVVERFAFTLNYVLNTANTQQQNAQQRRRRRPLILTVHNVTTARDFVPLSAKARDQAAGSGRDVAYRHLASQQHSGSAEAKRGTGYHQPAATGAGD